MDVANKLRAIKYNIPKANRLYHSFEWPKGKSTVSPKQNLR